MPLPRGLSLAIAPLKGRKSLTMVWSIKMLRSAKNKMRFFAPLFHKRQMIWKAVYVLPVPVAMTRSARFCPLLMASTVRLMAVSW